MSEAQIQKAARELEEILVRERKMLLSGWVRDAVDLSGEKLSVLERFEKALNVRLPAPASAATRQLVQRVVQLSDENSLLLAAVRNGVRSLIARFERPAEDAYVGSYRQGGHQIAFTNATGQYLKRV